MVGDICEIRPCIAIIAWPRRSARHTARRNHGTQQSLSLQVYYTAAIQRQHSQNIIFITASNDLRLRGFSPAYTPPP